MPSRKLDVVRGRLVTCRGLCLNGLQPRALSVPHSVHLDASGDVLEGHDDGDAAHDDPSCMNGQIRKLE
jgi:hypothetical protein